MKDLDKHYNSMMTSLDKLTRLTIDILIGLGHTRMNCATCKKDTDIQEVSKNTGYCDVCVVALRRKHDNTD
jgi:hypothetical protein